MVSILLSLAGIGIKIWLWMRGNANRMLGRAEAERDVLKETLDRVEKAQAARRELHRTPNYLGGVPDKYNRDK